MSNEDFYYAVKNGSQTWRGAISGWFNSTTASFLKRNNITRSLFKNYINEVERAEAGNTKEVAKKLMAEQAGDDFEDVGVKRKEVEAEEVKDEDGNLVPVKDDDGKIAEKDIVVET